jgi:3-isopropylmalate/(R)-2-methylmalate dehydratase large subunit
MRPVAADPDAAYDQEVVIDLAALAPQVARPHTFENVVPIAALRGHKVHPRTRLLVQPSSWAVYRAAMERGYFGTILDAGGQVLSPGCHLCLGMQGALAPGDVCISATTRNHRGRMGSGEADIYLASPVTVAAAAIAGEIVDPRETQP